MIEKSLQELESTMQNIYLFYMIIFLIIISEERKKHKFRRRTESEKNAMKELITRLIGKNCILYTTGSGLSGGQYVGVIKEITDGAILIVDKQSESRIVSLEFLVSVREHPKNKKGKDKAIVWN